MSLRMTSGLAWFGMQPWLKAEPVEAATSRPPSAVAAKVGWDRRAKKPNAGGPRLLRKSIWS
jgi:hypothetical protein